MERLDDYQFGSGNTTYDWDTILDGNIYRLVPDEDFTSTPKSFNLMVRERAKKRGGRAQVQTERDKDGNVTGLVIRFIPASSNGKAAK